MATYADALNEIAGKIISGSSGHITPAKLKSVLDAIVAAAEDEMVAVTAAFAPIDSPSLTGTPTAPTATPGTNTTQLATTAFVAAAVSALVNAAPGLLDTLDEIAAALGDDANFATTMTNALALKAPLASPTLTGTPAAPTATPGTNTTQIATTAFVQAAMAALPVLSDGDKGDITLTGSGTVWTIDNGVVTPAKMSVFTGLSATQRDNLASQLLTTKNVGASYNADSLTTPGWYFLDSTATNVPTAGQQYYVEVIQYPSTPDYLVQIAFDIDGSHLYVRYRQATTFGSWLQIYPVASHVHAASDITSGTMATARLGSGTANSSSFLRGDQTWAAASSMVELIGSTAISTAVSSVTHTFTASAYSEIIVVCSNLSPAAAANLQIRLSYSGGVIVTNTIGCSTAGDYFTGTARFWPNLDGGTSYSVGRLDGYANTNGVASLVGETAYGSNANAADRIQVIAASGNIDDGTIKVYGVKAS